MIHRHLHIPMDAIRSLCQKYQVARLEVFGSALTDTFAAQSDVDLLVEFQPQVRSDRTKMKRKLPEAARSLLPDYTAGGELTAFTALD